MAKTATVDLPAFRKLLKRAIGPDRNQAQFAAQSGITPAHLNKLLNSDSISQPSKATLMKISGNAYTPIPLKAFLSVCGYDAEEDVSAFLKKRSFEERAHRCIGLLTQGLTEMISTPVAYPSVYDFAEAVAFEYAEEEISISVSGGEKPAAEESKTAEMAAVVSFIWGGVDKTATMDVVLLYCPTVGGSVIVTNYLTRQKDVSRYNSGAVKGLIELDCFEEEKPAVLIRFRTLPKRKPDPNDPRTPEERLLDAIFGKADEKVKKRLSVVEGVGFYLDRLSDETLRLFLRKHENTFCKTDDDRAVFHSFVDMNQSREDAFANYCIDDPGMVGDSVWGGAVTNIIFRETSIRTEFWDAELFEEDNFNNRSAIIFSDKAPWLYSDLEKMCSRETLVKTLDLYARELRVEVTDCYFYMFMDVQEQDEK